MSPSHEDIWTRSGRRLRFSPGPTRWVVLRPVEELEDDERAYRTALCQESRTIATTQALAEDFGRIVRG